MKKILIALTIISILFVVACGTPYQPIVDKPIDYDKGIDDVPTDTGDETVDSIGDDLDDLIDTDEDLDLDELDDIDSTLEDIENI
tara:strand:- start:1999 stop:2253 length:255 start_codon:yes stop_codon:yes gene_type:complete